MTFRRPLAGPAGDVMPFYWNGEHHLFMTCPADGSWHHAVSRDVATWEELDVALAPSGRAPDAEGCWTGSVVERDGVFHAFYTGFNPGDRFPQTICHATGSDLVRFEKDPRNPISLPDVARYEAADWRDPYVFWNDEAGCWWMLLSARLAEGPPTRRGCLALLTSDDLETWSEPATFHAPRTTYSLECPELFRLGDRWYLLYSRFSEDAQTVYRVAERSTGPWRTAAAGGLDGPRAYAARTLWDGSRRLLWGTVYDREGERNDGDWSYGGDLCLPRELVPADADGALAVRCAPEPLAAYATERAPRWTARQGDWRTGERAAQVDATGACAWALFDAPAADYVLELTLTPHDVRDHVGVLLKATPELDAAWALVFEPRAERVAIVRWPQPIDPVWARLASYEPPPPSVAGPRLAERRLALRDGEPVTLRVVVNGTLVEAFAGDLAALTCRVYDERPFSPGLIVQDGAAAFDAIRLRTLA